MPDYIPSSDHEFTDWASTFMGYLTAHTSDLGIGATEPAPIGAAVIAFGDSLIAMNDAHAAFQTATQAKNDARANAERLIRGIVRRLQASTSVSDTERAALGITVRDTTPTATPAPPAPSRPIGRVDTSQRLQHTIAFSDQATPTSRAKPQGAMGCEIVVKIGGPAPVDPSECQFLALDSASPYVATYSGADANKMAHYMLRWASKGGDKGPWSETVSATIGG